jgi:alpha/beta superfamily hydrolase
MINTGTSIKSFFLDGPAGQLEALLNPGTDDATHSAVVCHPHPLFGGTMHTKAVFHTMKALNGFGFPVLRFNFRGVGLSAGEHDNGHGEVADVRTAIEWLASEFHLPIIFAGFSFGAAIGMRAASSDPRVAGLISLGTPVKPVDDRAYDFSFLESCTRPKLFLSGARDEFGPRRQLEALVGSLPEPKKLVLIEGADHFFDGRLREMKDAIEQWVREELLASRS